MFWRYWARQRGSDPPIYSPVVRQDGQSAVLTTILSRQLPPDAVLLGEFRGPSGPGEGPAVPLDPVTH